MEYHRIKMHGLTHCIRKKTVTEAAASGQEMRTQTEAPAHCNRRGAGAL
jgi:hypothetical protein